MDSSSRSIACRTNTSKITKKYNDPLGVHVLQGIAEKGVSLWNSLSGVNANDAIIGRKQKKIIHYELTFRVS